MTVWKTAASLALSLFLLFCFPFSSLAEEKETAAETKAEQRNEVSKNKQNRQEQG